MLAKYLFVGLILLLSMGAPGALGDEQNQPSMELLEFLGQWETKGGNWIDPTQLDDMTLPDEEQKYDEQKEKEKSGS